MNRGRIEGDQSMEDREKMKRMEERRERREEERERKKEEKDRKSGFSGEGPTRPFWATGSRGSDAAVNNSRGSIAE